MCTGLSTIIHRINPNFTASFQGVPPSDLNASFCCYLLQLPFRHTLPSQIKIISALYYIHTFLDVFTQSTLPKHPSWYLKVLNKSHFSESCRLPTKDTLSPITNSTYILTILQYPRTPPRQMNTREKSSPISNSRDEPWFTYTNMHIPAPSHRFFSKSENVS